MDDSILPRETESFTHCKQEAHYSMMIRSSSRFLRQGRLITRIKAKQLARHYAYYALADFNTPYIYSTSEPSVIVPPTKQPILATSKVQKDIVRRIIQLITRIYRNIRDGMLLSLRGAEVGLRLSPLILLTPASIAFHSILEENVVSDFTWWYIIRTMQALGPSYTKLCQWLASRRDMIPAHVCDRLSVTHDKGYPHPWKHTENVLKETFGDKYVDRLIVDSSEVIGCGSAAQVYRAQLDGRTVAVKVLHPRFQQLVERDLWFMQTVADWIHSIPFDIIKVVNMPRAVETFGSVLRRQADLRVEAENLEQFRKNFYKDNKPSSILFPAPCMEWCGPEVLVEDFVGDATPISEYLKMEYEDRRQLASPLLRAFLKMIFLDNFTHCDLHPGNVLVRATTEKPEPTLWEKMTGKTRTEPTEETKYTIIFLDAGIATALDERGRKNLKDLFRAIILNDGYEAGCLMVERALNERCSQKPGGVEAFASGIEEIVSEFHDRRKEGLTLGQVRIGSLLGRVLDLCREHGVEVDPGMASIVISTLVLEGLGRSLDSSLNLIDFAIPFVLDRGRV